MRKNRQTSNEDFLTVWQGFGLAKCAYFYYTCNHQSIFIMKKLLIIPILLVAFAFAVGYTYTKDQLMEPADLAKVLNDTKAKKPVVLNVGSVDDIKTAINVGPASIKQGIDKMNAALPKIKKDQSIVIYCGCCALEHCENIPPALKLLKEKGYKKVKVLNIPVGIGEDWKSKGYPMNK